MKKITAILTSILITFMVGCATPAKDIPAQYVSPLIYDKYDCEQIGAELSRITRKVSETGARADDRASSDSGTMALGLILFWPSLFFLDNDGPEVQEYGRLKGEYEALEQTSIQKKCGYEFKTIVLPEKKVSEPQEAPL
jgi:hypothetical protein